MNVTETTPIIQIKYEPDENYLHDIFKELVYVKNIDTAIFICTLILMKNNLNTKFLNL